MKKNEETQEEKKLVWKFKDLPTASEVANLVETKVITPEEARTILFKEEFKKSDEVEALQEMVKTLSEMVKDLMSRQSNVTLVPYTKVVTVPRRWEPYWINAAGSTGVTMSSTSAGGQTTYTLSV
jgi:hypothetical protein